MGKIIRLTESDLIKLVNKAINESETNEQIGKWFKQFGSAAKETKLLNNIRQIEKQVSAISSISPSLKGLLARIGLTITLTPQIKSALGPIDRQLSIVKNDIARANRFNLKGPQGMSPLLHVEASLGDIGRVFTSNFPRFEPVDMLINIENSKHELAGLMKNPQYRKMLPDLKNVMDELTKLRTTFEETISRLPSAK